LAQRTDYAIFSYCRRWSADPLGLDGDDDFRLRAEISPITFDVIGTSNRADTIGLLNVFTKIFNKGDDEVERPYMQSGEGALNPAGVGLNRMRK